MELKIKVQEMEKTAMRNRIIRQVFLFVLLSGVLFAESYAVAQNVAVGAPWWKSPLALVVGVFVGYSVSLATSVIRSRFSD